MAARVAQASSTNRFNRITIVRTAAPTPHSTATASELLSALNSAHNAGRPVIQQLGNSAAAAAPADARAMAGSAAATTTPTWNALIVRVQRLHAQPARAPRLTDRAAPLATPLAAPTASAAAAVRLAAVNNADEKDDESNRVRYPRGPANGFERAVQAAEFNEVHVEREYRGLAARERRSMDQFIWNAAGRPNWDDFGAEDYITDSGRSGCCVLQRAVEMVQAHRRLAVFSARIDNLNIQTADGEAIRRTKARLFDTLACNEDGRAGSSAQDSLVTACAFVRGMNARADDCDIGEYNAQALGNFDGITKTAARSLVENNLSLLPTVSQRLALLYFVSRTRNRPGPGKVREALELLEDAAPSAYNLLLRSFANSHARAHNIALPANALWYGRRLVHNLKAKSGEKLAALGFVLCQFENGFAATNDAVIRSKSCPDSTEEDVASPSTDTSDQNL